MSIERNYPIPNTAKFFPRQAVGEESSRQARAIPPQENNPTLRGNQCEHDRKHRGQWLEKYPVERADPRKPKHLDQQEND